MTGQNNLSEKCLSKYVLASFTQPNYKFELLFCLNTYPISTPNDSLTENLIKITARTRPLPVSLSSTTSVVFFILFYFISFANRQGHRNSLRQLLRARN